MMIYTYSFCSWQNMLQARHGQRSRLSAWNLNNYKMQSPCWHYSSLSAVSELCDFRQVALPL